MAACEIPVANITIYLPANSPQKSKNVWPIIGVCVFVIIAAHRRSYYTLIPFRGRLRRQISYTVLLNSKGKLMAAMMGSRG
jgi:hypothetical protein